MQARVDAVGRVLIPKALRDSLGLRSGSVVDISAYGAGIEVIPSGRTAVIEEHDGVAVARGTTEIDDATMFDLIDAGRR